MFILLFIVLLKMCCSCDSESAALKEYRRVKRVCILTQNPTQQSSICHLSEPIMQTETPLITVKRHHKAMVEMTKDKKTCMCLCISGFYLTLTGPQISKSRQMTRTTSDLNQTDSWNVLLYKSQVSSNKISHSFTHIDEYNQTYISMRRQSLYSGCLF